MADWDGPDLWEVPVDENKAESGIEVLEEGRCPIDGTLIKWEGLIPARLLVDPDWEKTMGLNCHSLGF